MRKGLFITIEGPDGAGKSTQIQYIKEYFQNRNIDTIFTREPGGTTISEQIRQVILDKKNDKMTYLTEALLYAAARAQLVDEVIKPALELGKVIICDRFVDSSIAYQSYGRGLGSIVEEINSYAVKDCMPDMTILLMVDSQRGIDRIEVNDNREEKDRIELEGMDFHGKVVEGYAKLSERFPERIKVVDGSQSIETVRMNIERHLDIAVGAQYGI